MQNYPGNSNLEKDRAKAENDDEKDHKVERVVEGKVIIRKKPLGRKIKETFFGGDTKGVVSYLVRDVFVPAAQDMIIDMVTQGVERVIFPDGGSGGGRRRRPRPGGPNRTDYQSPFQSRTKSGFSTTRVDPREESRRAPNHRRETFDLQELVIPSRAEAEEVLSRMDGLIGKYGRVTVNELYDLVGVTGVWTGESYGWEDIRGARPRRDRSGAYWLDLPSAEELR